MAAAIEQLGLTAFKAPVLRIEPCRAKPPPGPFDFALFVSEHAVVHAVANGWLRAPWHSCPTAAIGAAASATLRDHGVAPCMAAQADAADVLRALPALPHTTLIVKGEGGRDLLQRKLRCAGGTVVEWDVYRRTVVKPDLADEDIDAIVASSGEGARAIANIWFSAGRSARVPLLVPSQRVAEVAAQAGFDNVVVTLGANPTAVGAALASTTQRIARTRLG